MLDGNAKLSSTSTLQEGLGVTAFYLSAAFQAGMRSDRAPSIDRDRMSSIHKDLIPSLTFSCAVRAGLIPRPKSPQDPVVDFGNYAISYEDRDRFIALLPSMREIAQDLPDKNWLNPAELFELFKRLAGLSEEQIAYDVRCSEKTLQRLKRPGYPTDTQILENLAEYMDRILGERLKSCPTLLSHGTATQLANLHGSRLVWLPRQY